LLNKIIHQEDNNTQTYINNRESTTSIVG